MSTNSVFDSIINEEMYSKAVAVLAPKIGSTFKQSLVEQLAKGESLISGHFGLGMQVRNALRESRIFPAEEELPEHFYDQTWMVLLLKASDFSEDDLRAISIEGLLTSSDEYARWTGATLVALYKDKSPLIPLCQAKLDEK